MPDINEIRGNVQSEVFKLVAQTQENTVELVKAVTKAVNEKAPGAFTRPVAERLPQVGRVVNSAFGFATALLSMQQAFVNQILEAATPEKKQAPAASTKTAA